MPDKRDEPDGDKLLSGLEMGEKGGPRQCAPTTTQKTA
jgi:hypothetical protein